MKNRFVNEHKIINIIQTALILVSMLGFLALLGLVIAGIDGVLLALFVGLIMILFYPSINPSIIARLYGAKPILFQQAPDLFSYLKRLTERAEIENMPELYLINTDTMTAFTIGHRKNCAIVISTGLLERLEFPEIVGVLAHEIAHIANRDLWLMSITDIISRLTAILSVIGQLLVLFYLPFYLFGDIYIPWLGIFILISAPLASSLLQLMLSRVREYDADLTAAYLTGETANLAKALAKIEYAQRSLLERIFFPTRQEKIPSLFRTHPETKKRIEKLLSIQLPKEIQPLL